MQSKCQVFTPDNVVNKLLDEVGYRGALFGKKVCENSCGTGNILVGIVKRYIESCREDKLTDAQIKSGLKNDIFAADIDASCCAKARERLDRLVARYGIQNVNWNIANIDFLTAVNSAGVFDYIIGNPPYVSYEDIDYNTRKMLRQNFATCSKGKFDYYYAFFEKAILQMSENGRLAYIVPNSCFKNVFASSLRDMIRPLVSTIVDYKNRQLFDVLTSSAIVVLSKQGNNGFFHYKSIENGADNLLPSKVLETAKWTFSTQDTKDGEQIFGEVYIVSNSIATLCNRVFIIDSKEIEESSSSLIRLRNGLEIEKAVLKKAFSPKSMRLKKDQYAIFPYRISKGVVESYDDNSLSQQFPLCHQYLLRHKVLLGKRASDKQAQWFEYGRRQGFKTVSKRKLIISTVVTDSVHIYEVDADSVVYAGIVITCETEALLAEAKKTLESRSFLDYVHDIGTNVSGSSIRITARDVSLYRYCLTPSQQNASVKDSAS